MKKLILSALVLAGLNLSAGSIGIKPIVNEPTCNGGTTGTIELIVVGAVGNVSYSWSDALPPVRIQTGLSAGAYTVTVTDSIGETANYTVNMGQPSAMNLTTTAQNVSVHGGSDGCVNVTVDGGTPDYTYFWSNGATIQNPCGLTAGTYTVDVTDAFGCTSTASKTITQPSMVAHHTSAYDHDPIVSGSTPTAGHLRSDDLGTGTDNNGTPNEMVNTDVAVYPNPATDHFILNTGVAANSQISVINILGQVALQRQTDAAETTVDVSTLAKGNYVVMVKNENGITSTKLTIAK